MRLTRTRGNANILLRRTLRDVVARIYVAAARELRDRYLEEVNANRLLPGAQGKYDVSRQLEAAPSDLKLKPLLAEPGTTGKLAA